MNDTKDPAAHPEAAAFIRHHAQAGNGTEFLFIEAGGFQTKNGNTWKCPWFVMKRP